ncbi:MAG: ATP-binding protein [Candidatus Rokubacteria bacterium]|nr:ATP-binding protein [Candidatus Rokubacteria bacterium]
MVRRRYHDVLRRVLRRFPIVTVLGPRQCGKTTFILQALPGRTYLDLERPSDATPLAADPEARLGQLRGRGILDEAQRLPDLFPVLRGVVDREGSRAGRFVLLGSASPALVRHISESLAGRTAFLDLPPFRWDEVAARRGTEGLFTLWFRGGFPVAFLERDDRARHAWLENYTRAFIERDLPTLGIDVSASQMRRLWAMLAHVNGGIWNASQLAASLGVSYHTVNRYVDILEQTFLIRKLPPYHANVRKRLVKSPKVYFRDTGLLHYFLGVRTREALDTHPARGASWEAFVIDQLVSAYERVVPGTQAFFWRTAQGDEVDLLIAAGTRRVPFEIKLHSAPGAGDVVGLRRCLRDLRLSRGYVIYPGREAYSLGNGVTTLPAESLLRRPENVARL